MGRNQRARPDDVKFMAASLFKPHFRHRLCYVDPAPSFISALRMSRKKRLSVERASP